MCPNYVHVLPPRIMRDLARPVMGASTSCLLRGEANPSFEVTRQLASLTRQLELLRTSRGQPQASLQSGVASSMLSGSSTVPDPTVPDPTESTSEAFSGRYFAVLPARHSTEARVSRTYFGRHIAGIHAIH